MTFHYAFILGAFALPRLFGADAAPEPRIVHNLGKLPLAFEKSQSQAADFLARGAGYTVSLSQGNAHIALRLGKDAPPATVDLRLVGARRNPPAAGCNALPGKVNYFLGNDPTRWRTDIPTFARVEYSDVYRGIGLAYYGNQGRLEYDFIVAPGADPTAIRLVAAGASKVQVDRRGDLVLDTGGGEVRFLRPVSYQRIAGKRRPVESKYLFAGANEVRFTLGFYDVRYPVVIDPSLAYSTYLGGSAGESAAAIAVGPDGNAFVTGMSYSTDFPLVDAEQASYPGDGAMFVAKFNAEGSGLVYSTYFGNSDTDTVHAIAVDNTGSAYIVGSTMSQEFPLKNPLYSTLEGYDSDAFITKFSPLGNALVYSTYLGGSGYDSASTVAVDASHNAYIGGSTSSTDFPVTAGAYQTSCSANTTCGFVAKVNAAESALTWSTYFGPLATPNYNPTVAAIAVDSRGGVYLTGGTTGGLPVTAGAPQPTFGGIEDAYVAKLSNTGDSLPYCTYLGGAEWDIGNAIAVDSAGNAYVAGETESSNLPVTTGALQTKLAGHSNAFVAKVDNAGAAWQYLTYLGGNRYDGAEAIAVDSSGDAIAAGFTWSSDFPTAAAVQPVLPGNQTALFKTTSAGNSWSPSDTGIADKSISAIVINPAEDADLFALTDAGLFESVNGGTSWSVNAGLEFTYLSFLAFSPSGEVAYTALDEEELYVSYDSGTTWYQLSQVGFIPCSAEAALVDPSGNLFVGGGGYGQSCAQELTPGGIWFPLGIEVQNGGYGFALAPGSPGTLYAATGNGVFQAADSEPPLTWTAAGLQGQTVSAVVVDSSQPSTLYALLSGAVFKSTDAGNSWTSSSTGLTVSATSLAIAPSNASVLCAGTPGGMFFSKNGAAWWFPAGLGLNQITALAVDLKSANKVYAATPTYYDGFVAKINPAGSKLVYSTFLGGANYDDVYGAALDSSGNVFVTGTTQSPDFPTTPGAFQSATGLPRYSAFVAKIEQQTPACSYAASPSTVFFYPGGGSARSSIVSPAGCAWTPGPSASWITVTSGAGPGVAPLAIDVAANTAGARTGTITIGDTSIGITQAAGGCAYSLSSNSLSFQQAGGSQSVNVTAGAGCQWVVTGLPLWLTVTSGASGTGNGTVTLEAAPNIFSYTRPEVPYTINVANTAVSVSQSATSPALLH